MTNEGIMQSKETLDDQTKRFYGSVPYGDTKNPAKGKADGDASKGKKDSTNKKDKEK